MVTKPNSQNPDGGIIKKESHTGKKSLFIIQHLILKLMDIIYL